MILLIFNFREQYLDKFYSSLLWAFVLKIIQAGKSINFGGESGIQDYIFVHWIKKTASWPPSKKVSEAGISSSNAATFGLGGVQVIATAVYTWLVDKTGRQILLIISSSGMTISLFVVAVSFFVKGFVADNSTPIVSWTSYH